MNEITKIKVLERLRKKAKLKGPYFFQVGDEEEALQYAIAHIKGKPTAKEVQRRIFKFFDPKVPHSFDVEELAQAIVKLYERN